MSEANQREPIGFIRLKEIVGAGGIIPISRSSFLARVKSGEFPPPHRIGPRTTAWRRDAIVELVERLAKPSNTRRDSK